MVTVGETVYMGRRGYMGNLCVFFSILQFQLTSNFSAVPSTCYSDSSLEILLLIESMSCEIGCRPPFELLCSKCLRKNFCFGSIIELFHIVLLLCCLHPQLMCRLFTYTGWEM